MATLDPCEPPHPENAHPTPRVPDRLGALAAVLGIALLARLPYLSTRSLWYDEASSWQTASFSLSELIPSLRLNVHLPLYYLLLKGWMAVFGDSVVALRGFSVALGVATVAGMYLVAGEVYDLSTMAVASAERGTDRRRQGFALAVAALVALNPFQVNASIEARMYALGTALAASSSVLLLRIVRGLGSPLSWPAYGASALAFLYTHHYALFSVAAQAVFLLSYVARLWWRDETRRAGVLLGRGSLVGLALLIGYLPALSLLMGQTRRVRENYWTVAPDHWRVLDTCRQFVLPVSSPGSSTFWVEAMAAAAAIVAASLCLAWHLGRGEGFVLASALLPMAFAGLVSLWTPVWESRYFRFSQPFLLLAVVMATWRIAGRSDRLRAILLGMLLIGSLATDVRFWELRDIPHRPGMRGAMERILRSPRRSDLIVSDTDLQYFVAKYYAPPGIRVRLDRDATKQYWGSHLIRDDDLISDAELARALPQGVWILRMGIEPPRYDKLADVSETCACRFAYDRGVPDWTVYVTHLQGSVNGSALARAVAGVRARRSGSIDLGDWKRIRDSDLEQVRGLAGLRQLNLGGTGVTDRGLACLTGLNRLRGLSLSATRVTGAGLEALRDLPELRQLNLDRLPLSRDGLARLTELRHLKDLSLWRTTISDAGLERLAAHLDLERLSLDETSVSDRGLRALRTMKSLEYLSVWKTRVSEGGIRELRERRPRLKINR